VLALLHPCSFNLSVCILLTSLSPSFFLSTQVPSAPLPTGRRSSALRMSASDMIGIDVETGGLFDPLGFSKDEQSLYRYRAVELKHGRVAMLACLGTLVQSYTHLPDDVFSNPRPLAALGQIASQRPLAILQIVLALVFIEVTAGKQDAELAPGQIGRFGEAFKPEGEEEMAAVQLKELKNGRLAMVRVSSGGGGGGVGVMI
jgi:light-harvesting complex I chlorophyll a/b binding protein 1